MTGFYARSSPMTAPGRYESLLAGLPRGAAALAPVVQGLLIHERHTALYGVTLPPERRASTHIRPVARILDRVADADSLPLTIARDPARRVAGSCRHFAVLMVAMLRAQRIPARARCGFGGYFAAGLWDDHWVCEYWDATTQCWRRADPQIDVVQREVFGIGFDPMNVPRDQFLAGGQAWDLYRQGEADPGRFGLSLEKQAGTWWIAGNVLRDVAALNKAEMLPWDVWGAMPAHGQPVEDENLALLDRLATLTREPDVTLPELQEAYSGDSRVRVPGTVWNQILGRDEVVEGLLLASQRHKLRSGAVRPLGESAAAF